MRVQVTDNTIEKTSNLKNLLGIGFIALVWGGSWPVSRIGLEHSDLFLLAASRCLIAAGSLWLWIKTTSKQTKVNSPHQVPLKVFFVSGATWVGIPTVLMLWALQYVPSGLGSILHSTVPLFVALFSWGMFKEQKITREIIIGVILGFFGIVVMYSNKTMATKDVMEVVGAAAILGASALLSFAQLYSHKHTIDVDPVEFTMKINLIGGLMILPFAFMKGVPFLRLNATMIFVFVFLGIFASALPNVLYVYLYKRIKVVILSMVTYLIPIVAVITAMIVLNETLTTLHIIGAVCILGGVLIATQMKSKK
jgi:drug/metabolite transporter (DMT)-like permease